MGSVCWFVLGMTGSVAWAQVMPKPAPIPEVLPTVAENSLSIHYPAMFDVLALAVLSPSNAKPQLAAASTPKVEKVTVNAPVTLTDNGATWVLGNGIVKLAVAKRDGNLSSLVYYGVSIITGGREWEQTPSGTVTSTVTTDPATNGGERAEVAVKGVNSGGTGGRGGGIDIETRITLERGTSGFYTYDQYTHQASYPLVHVGENRFILQNLNPDFDWLSVDKDRNMLMSKEPEDHPIHAKEQSIYTSGLYNNSVEHKYSYNALMCKITAWGWYSSADRVVKVAKGNRN